MISLLKKRIQCSNHTSRCLRIGKFKKRNNIDGGNETVGDYPLTNKPTISMLASIIEIETGRGWQISFVQDDTLRDLLGYEPFVINED